MPEVFVLRDSRDCGQLHHWPISGYLQLSHDEETDNRRLELAISMAAALFYYLTARSKAALFGLESSTADITAA